VSSKLSRRHFIKIVSQLGIGAVLASCQSGLATPAARTPTPASPYADFIFQNGKIYTINPKQPWADALAVKGNQIISVGTAAAASKWIGPSTQVVDLQGRMLMPGFIDGHNHFVAGALGKRGLNLDGCKSTAEIVARLKGYVQAHPEKKLILGYNWSFLMFTDKEGTRQDLDSVCPDKPVFFFNEDMHNAWFNTKAMEQAFVGWYTPDPVPGSSYYRREPDGTPTGIAFEPDAYAQVAFFTGGFNGAETIEETMQMVLPQLAPNGITAYHDMGIFAPTLQDADLGFSLLQDWERKGKLNCRVVGTLGTRDANESPFGQLNLLKSWNERFRSELVQVTGLKIWGDGIYLAHTGVQLEPYADRPGFSGDSAWTVQNLVKWIEPAHLAGFDVHIHVDGDGQVRRCLDAFETVIRRHGLQGRRHALHHTYMIHPDDLPRFKNLGVGANATGAWFVNYKGQYEEAIKILGQKRVATEFSIQRKLLDLGVNLSMGSDIPGTDVEELAPLYQMQAPYSGRMPGDQTTVVPPTEHLFTLEELLRIYTINGAYQMRMEDKLGSLEEGKYADLIVLEKNLFDVPKDQLSQTKIQLTMMNGRIVHRQGI
jgi:predicted amidohydrolase YtcJ